MDIENVLVEYENKQEKEVYANSGMMFSRRRFVMITGNVLMPYIKTNEHKIDSLKNAGRGSLYFDHDFFPDGLKVVASRRNPNSSAAHIVDSGAVSVRRARVLALFFCPNISVSSRRYLKEWAVDRELNSFLDGLDELVSLFFVLQVEDDEGRFQGLGTLRLGLIEALAAILDRSSEYAVGKIGGGESVWIESTPFGNRIFLNSYSEGVISNVTGHEDCFVLTDCATSPGCEGSPVFLGNKRKNTQSRIPLGIVISCLNWWKGEWVGLTLVANWRPLLSQLVGIPLKRYLEIPPNIQNHLWNTAQKGLVQVVSATCWGTGILLDKRKGIFLTNAHVIFNSESAKLFWKGRQLASRVIYKTPDDGVYDLGLLRCTNLKDLHALEMSEITLSPQFAKEGEVVYAAGYPLFASELKPSISLTRGHVSRVQRSMINTTCNVLPGASGGAILRSGGEAIGVIVSNTKMGKPGEDVVFPRVNMAIPTREIRNIIDEFLRSGDAEILQKLQISETLACRPWLQLSGKL